MPQVLPGFYYDAEKNRYFPIKGPIPGTSRRASSITEKKPNESNQAKTFSTNLALRTSKLLNLRELNGSIVPLNRGRHSVKEEFHKIEASQPMVWKYPKTDNMGNSALEHIQVDVGMPEGQTQKDILLAGNIDGSLRWFEVANAGHLFETDRVHTPDLVRSCISKSKTEIAQTRRHNLLPVGSPYHMASGISSIKSSSRQTRFTDGDLSSHQYAMISTLGSESHGGSVHVLDLFEPLDPYSSLWRRIEDVASFNCTIWTSDCYFNSNRAVIGTDLGAALVNLETQVSSWVLRCKSAVLAQQFHNSGNVVLCGLRNGAIVTVDIRVKQNVGSSSKLVRHRLPYPKADQNSSRQWFELKGDISDSHTVYMPSSVSSLVSLHLHDQYFLASSMDGLIRLYDHRLTKRGPVQTYEGNVNSHTPLQLGVDPSERFVLSGGEDCKTRVWSMKSGELLFEDKFSNSVCSAVCWPRLKKLPNESHEEVWLGSSEGFFNMQWY